MWLSRQPFSFYIGCEMLIDYPEAESVCVAGIPNEAIRSIVCIQLFGVQ
jgi:hypothetical protein